MEPRYQYKCVALGERRNENSLQNCEEWSGFDDDFGLGVVLPIKVFDWWGGWGSKHTKNTPKIMVNSKITSNTWVGQKHQELGWGFETIGWAIELYTVVHITCMKYCSAPKFHTHNIYFLHYFFTKYNIYPKIWFLLRFFTSRRFTSHWTSLVYNNSRYYHVLRKYMRKRIVA